jgi:hypothetical protein
MDAGKNISLYSSSGKIYLKLGGSFHIHKTIPRNHVSTCKLDFGGQTHSEISKRKMFLDFLDMMYAKRNHSHHTPMYKEIHILILYTK